MQAHRHHGFLSGLFLGAALSLGTGLVAGYLLVTLDVVSIGLVETPGIQAALAWTRRNLGLSVLPFTVVMVLYLYNLRALEHRLADDRPQEEIAQLEHLTDVWTSLFFGIGVIWTAIGMRSALLYALGDPATAAESGAYAILQRLVDGGILTALTTTIVGGIGGYLMRVVKSSWLGTRLSRYYEARDLHHATRVERLLQDIHASLGVLGAGTGTAACEVPEER
jgi:hypothetical protein